MAPNIETAGHASPAVHPGLITLPSTFAVAETTERLARVIESKGLTVFCRIDHAANATSAGLSMRPTVVLIFGNARGGTPLMQAQPTLGIDLPLKALAWEDASGGTWLSYNDPAWLASRHGLDSGVPAVVALREALGAMTRAATMP
ncbi:MAG TPA: DUF302 domain-containing protein [Steroidobacteraceae bacterium]|jgi:uncharacterized protein (DUF302 family)